MLKKKRVGRASGLVSRWQGDVGEGMRAPSPFPRTLPRPALPSLSPELHPFVINQQCSK